ncbi:MAG: DUF4037 domain-containing protein [Candidatus Latescibacteria bacterium]|nr:DUF4037 domain-containing protein [Candidatus Latescibacterota bacterium]
MTKLFAAGEPRPPFIPGLDLAEGFFTDLVRPMLEAHLPDMSYAAAVLAGGSDVLGFDTEMSTDHDWGPRVMLFLKREDFEARARAIRALAMEHLPLAYRDYPVRIYDREVQDIGTRLRQRPNDPGLEPRIEIDTIHGFFQKQLGVDLNKPLSAADWLTMTHHRLRSIVDGRVFRDDVGLQAVRDRFCWYPDDVWLYVLASCWLRINEDETLTGRAGSVGDNLGSTVIAWRLIRDMMRLAFLMERSYPPYPKWLGSAFAQLQCAGALGPLLERVGTASDWRQRDGALADAYRNLAEMHNALRLTAPVPCEPMRRGERPFTVSQAGPIAEALQREIGDPSVRAIADRWMIGNIDLFNDNHMLDDDPAQRPLLLQLYN